MNKISRLSLTNLNECPTLVCTVATSPLLKSNKIYSKDFFEKYINFTIFPYLRCCGVIPVQSCGSPIRPQPPGLGLK